MRALLFLIPALAWSQDTLLVLSKADHTLAIVDPATLKVIGKAPVGEDPHEVIASTDGKTAYVSNYGGGKYNTLAVVDLVTRKALPPIDLGPLRGPHGLAAFAGKIYFTSEIARAIASYDPASQKVDWILGTGQDRTHMIYISGNGRMYTTNIRSATVTIIDPNFDETVVPVGKGAEGFDLSPDGKELWTANAQSGTVSIIDLATKQVTAHAAGQRPRRQPPEIHARWQTGAHLLADWLRLGHSRRRNPQGAEAYRRRQRCRWNPNGTQR